jgi:hypothetical protein
MKGIFMNVNTYTAARILTQLSTLPVIDVAPQRMDSFIDEPSFSSPNRPEPPLSMDNFFARLATGGKPITVDYKVHSISPEITENSRLTISNLQPITGGLIKEMDLGCLVRSDAGKSLTGCIHNGVIERVKPTEEEKKALAELAQHFMKQHQTRTELKALSRFLRFDAHNLQTLQDNAFRARQDFNFSPKWFNRVVDGLKQHLLPHLPK